MSDSWCRSCGGYLSPVATSGLCDGCADQTPIEAPPMPAGVRERLLKEQREKDERRAALERFQREQEEREQADEEMTPGEAAL